MEGRARLGRQGKALDLAMQIKSQGGEFLSGCSLVERRRVRDGGREDCGTWREDTKDCTARKHLRATTWKERLRGSRYVF
jgi:hypothetical protein